MTCEAALDLLLEAEPSEFSATDRTPLGEHLRGCARCRRVAAQLMHDTQRMALAMKAAVPARRPARRVMQATMVPAFAMAIVLAVVLRSRADAPSIAPPVNGPVTPVSAPSVTAGAELSAAAAPPVRSRVRRDVRREPRAFARAVPMAAVRLESAGQLQAPFSVESSGLTVTPPAGTRATVMHTSNPKLVVVWLH